MLFFNNVVLFNRGDDFREDFARLGEIRSIIPSHVNVMALTATATVSTRLAVSKTLCMISPSVIYVPPTKKNIRYSVSSKPTSVIEIVSQIASTLEIQGKVSER